MALKCPACGFAAGKGPGHPNDPKRDGIVPWNKIGRARTHKNQFIYVCDGCGTPLERKLGGFKATEAAAVGYRDGPHTFEPEGFYHPGDRTSDGHLVVPIGDAGLMQWVEPEEAEALLREAEQRALAGIEEAAPEFAQEMRQLQALEKLLPEDMQRQMAENRERIRREGLDGGEREARG